MTELRHAHGRPPGSTEAEMAERVLDRGLALDCEYGVDVVGVRLATVTGFFVVASFERYLALSVSHAGEVLDLQLPDWMLEERDTRSSDH